MLSVSWMARVTNLELLRRLGKDEELLSAVKERKLWYISHIMKGERYEMPRLRVKLRPGDLREEGGTRC